MRSSSYKEKSNHTGTESPIHKHTAKYTAVSVLALVIYLWGLQDDI